MTQLRALPKKHVREMQSIIMSIEKGTYKHFQADWHCGSTHCFAGWKEWRDYVREITPALSIRRKLIIRGTEDLAIAMRQQLTEPKPLNVWRAEKVGPPSTLLTHIGNYGGTGTYAMQAWELTEHEARALFDGCIELSEIKEVVGHLDKGLRKVTWGPDTDGTTWDSTNFAKTWIDPRTFDDWLAVNGFEDKEAYMDSLFVRPYGRTE